MDGRYQLRHRKVDGAAVLAVQGTTFRCLVPPDAESARVLETHAAAVAAMNSELARLTAKGWSLADVETAAEADAEAAEPEETSDELDDVVTSLERDGVRVTVNANESKVTNDQALAALLTELAKGCRELVISESQEYDAPWYQTVQPWCLALASLGSGELERLIVDTFSQPLSRQASVHCGRITSIFRACPSLRFAYIIGYAEIDSLAHDRLEDLTLMGDPIELDTLRAVLRGPCPRLSRLALGLGYERHAAAHADRSIVTALGGDGLPALTELHVAYPENGAALLDALASSPSFGKLRVLSIGGNVFANEKRGLALLKKHRSVLSKLERLYLPLEDVLSKSDEELVALLPPLRATEDAQVFSPARYGHRG